MTKMIYTNQINAKCLAILMAFFSLFTMNTAQAALLKMNVSDSTINVGDSFIVDLVLEKPFDNVSGGILTAFGLTLDFDRSALTLTDTQFSSSDWSDDSGLFANTDLAASHFPGIDDLAQPSILLAKLVFNANKVGDFVMKAFSDSTKPGEQGLFYLDQSFNDVTLDASAQTGFSVTSKVSEPSVLVLLLTSIGFLVRRRQNA